MCQNESQDMATVSLCPACAVFFVSIRILHCQICGKLYAAGVLFKKKHDKFILNPSFKCVYATAFVLTIIKQCARHGNSLHDSRARVLTDSTKSFAPN